jgi:hypothetical protein
MTFDLSPMLSFPLTLNRLSHGVYCPVVSLRAKSDSRACRARMVGPSGAEGR